MSVGIRVLLVPTILLVMLNGVGVAKDSSPVAWSVEMGGTGHSILIKVFPQVRIKDVRCEVKLLDASRHPVGSYTARFADKEDGTLGPGVEHSQTFTLDRTGVKHVEGVLLFARPALSSPKASTGGSTEILARGVPPLGSNR